MQKLKWVSYPYTAIYIISIQINIKNDIESAPQSV